MLPAVLGDLAGLADRAAVLTDFDGTLSAIVEDPAGARALEGAGEVLARLASRYRQVAVVSGRPVAFLADRLGLDLLAQESRISVFGVYGLEWAGPDGVVHTRADAEAWRATVGRAAAEARDQAGPGVVVELKGLAATIHWRRAPEEESSAQGLARRLAERWRLASHPGRRSVELRPPVEADKGTVVTSVCQAMTAACFVGDDRGDLPAFDALDRLASASGLLAVKVAVDSAEAPAELVSAADLVVDGPQGALALLASLDADAGSPDPGRRPGPNT